MVTGIDEVVMDGDGYYQGVTKSSENFPRKDMYRYVHIRTQ